MNSYRHVKSRKNAETLEKLKPSTDNPNAETSLYDDRKIAATSPAQRQHRPLTKSKICDLKFKILHPSPIQNSTPRSAQDAKSAKRKKTHATHTRTSGNCRAVSRPPSAALLPNLKSAI